MGFLREPRRAAEKSSVSEDAVKREQIAIKFAALGELFDIESEMPEPANL